MDRRINMSPWEIGQRHWNQRDLYTTNARIDAAGYGLGPSYHPEEGSFAYRRSPPSYAEPHRERQDIHEREAWPVGAPIRSDRSLHDDACASLMQDSWVDASDIDVIVKQGEITLEGTVTDRQQKKRAEDVVSSCMGVIDVHNRLKLRKDDDDGVAFTMPVVTAS